MSLSEKVQSIKHGETKLMFKKLKNRDTIGTKRSSVEFREGSFKNQLPNRRSEIFQPIIKKLNLLNLQDKKSFSSDEGDEYNVFNYDFMLSNVFGYK